jgi:hypothetical protein
VIATCHQGLVVSTSEIEYCQVFLSFALHVWDLSYQIEPEAIYVLYLDQVYIHGLTIIPSCHHYSI